MSTKKKKFKCQLPRKTLKKSAQKKKWIVVKMVCMRNRFVSWKASCIVYLRKNDANASKSEHFN